MQLLSLLRHEARKEKIQYHCRLRTLTRLAMLFPAVPLPINAYMFWPRCCSLWNEPGPLVPNA